MRRYGEEREEGGREGGSGVREGGGEIDLHGKVVLGRFQKGEGK